MLPRGHLGRHPHCDKLHEIRSKSQLQCHLHCVNLPQAQPARRHRQHDHSQKQLKERQRGDLACRLRLWHRSRRIPHREIGRLIEAIDDSLRATLQDNYTSKQRQITNTGRLLWEYMTDCEKQLFRKLPARGQLNGTGAATQEGNEVYR